jgi:hypothetical protein
MLPEFLLHLVTTAPRELRRMGLVHDSIGLWSRGTRHRRSWHAHEARCHSAVGQAIARWIGRGKQGRKAVVLGSGLVRDVPLALMLAAFREVVLVDAVHLPIVRARMALRPGVRLVTRDLSGLAGWLSGAAGGRTDPVADLAADPEVDFVLSANLLSQLPLGVETFLEKNPRLAGRLPADLADRTIPWHLADLSRFDGQVCLLSDVEMREEDRDGRVTDRLDLMRGQSMPAAAEAWDWTVAPFGEIERDRRYVHRVQAYPCWRKAVDPGAV